MKTFAVVENGIVANIIVGVEPAMVSANPTKFVEYTEVKPAGIGDTRDTVRNAFIAPKPFASWTLDANSEWQAPKPYPTDGKTYLWDEPTLMWKVQVDAVADLKASAIAHALSLGFTQAQAELMFR